jgi:hypothetical protein
MIDKFIYWCMGIKPPYGFLVFILTLMVSCMTGVILIAIAIDWFASEGK